MRSRTSQRGGRSRYVGGYGAPAAVQSRVAWTPAVCQVPSPEYVAERDKSGSAFREPLVQAGDTAGMLSCRGTRPPMVTRVLGGGVSGGSGCGS